MKAILTLRQNGSHEVSVTYDTTIGETASDQFELAEELFSKLHASFGTDKTASPAPIPPAPSEQPPTCATHNVQMVRKPGGISRTSGNPYPAFWSCPSKMQDGTYCRYRPA